VVRRADRFLVAPPPSPCLNDEKEGLDLRERNRSGFRVCAERERFFAEISIEKFHYVMHFVVLFNPAYREKINSLFQSHLFVKFKIGFVV
jgi:hypothetical protein